MRENSRPTGTLSVDSIVAVSNYPSQAVFENLALARLYGDHNARSTVGAQNYDDQRWLRAASTGERGDMRKIREVLRLGAQGLSKRRIAASLGISATAALECLQRARRAGLSWPLPDDLDGAMLELRLYRKREPATRLARPRAIQGTPSRCARTACRSPV